MRASHRQPGCRVRRRAAWPACPLTPMESHPHMWFRNLLVYRLTQDIPFDADTLEAALATKPARPCASQELTTYGFVAPFGKGADAPLVHVSEGFMLVAARKEE